MNEKTVVDAWDAFSVEFDRYYHNQTVLRCYEGTRQAIESLRVPPPLFAFPLFVELPSLTNQRVHHFKHAALKRRQRIAPVLECMSGLNKHGVPKGKIYVKLTRIIQSGHKLDDDNEKSAFKSVRDGIADVFGINDGSDRWQWMYEQRKPEKSDPPGLTGTVAISWKG